jgi:hypothetical protein
MVTIPKVNLRNLLVMVTASALLLGCAGNNTPATKKPRSNTTNGIRLTDIVRMDEEASAQVASAIKQNIFYFEQDGMCFAALASLGSKAYPVISITHIPCEKLKELK